MPLTKPEIKDLLTNNRKKIDDLARHGVNVKGRIPILTEPNKYNR